MIELFLLVRMELLRLLRTGQVYGYLFLPALLLLPLGVFVGVMLVSARGEVGTVAVPPDLPPELDLERHLREARLEVVVRADPRADWEARRVDAAIVGWRDGAGIGEATSLEVASQQRWRLDLVVDQREVRDQVRDAAESAGGDVAADWVALAGGSPDHDIDVVSLVTLDHPDRDRPLPFDPVRGALAYIVFMLGLVAFFFLSLPSVVDRREGVTETLRALPISPTRLVWARILALVVVQVIAAGLFAANVLLLLAQVDLELGLASAWVHVPGVFAAVLAVDALYGVLGVLAPSARLANNLSSTVMTATTVLLVWGTTGDPPAWIPLAGVLVAATPVEHVVAITASLGLAAVVVAITGHLLATRVSLVLGRGEP